MGLRERLFGRKKHHAEGKASGEQNTSMEQNLSMGQEVHTDQDEMTKEAEDAWDGEHTEMQETSVESPDFSGQEAGSEGVLSAGKEVNFSEEDTREHNLLTGKESSDGQAESAEEKECSGRKLCEEETAIRGGKLCEEERTLTEEKLSEEEKKGFFARLKAGLAKTRDNIVRGIDSVFNGFSAIDEDFYEELEEILIMGDIGVNATMEIVARLKQQIKEQHIKEPRACKQLLIEGIKEQMRVDETAYDFEKQQSIIMVIGVNGVGKTTSVGKLAGKLKEDGRKVLIAAADTFRAAAGDQLAEWARRADVPMVGGNEGADPASVVFDAVNAAKARGVDVLLIDTAGRLHNKKNLMEELRKMNRIIDREFPDAHRENLIVLDGTTGQNALVQAREFGAVAELTGIILTKMDGTAKGGIAVAIQSELRVPVKYIGVGETIDDLQKFDSDEFVNALFDVKSDEDDEDAGR